MSKKTSKILNIELTADKIVPGGQSISTLPDGKKIFLWNLLPGETANSIKITKDKSTFLEGIAQNIIHASNHRIKPKDECYLATSPWQIMDYDYELKQKQQILDELFQQHKLPQAEISAVKTDNNDYYYRNKMEYALYFDNQDQAIYPAVRGRGSHIKIPIKSSSLEKPEIWQRAQEIIHELNAKHQDARNFQSLLLRANKNGTVSGGLLENHRPHPVFPKLTDTILDKTYSYSPNGFFQINLPVYELALKEIQKHIKTNRVLDLYSGVGTIGLSVAPNCELTLVEIDKAAYGELVANCQNTPNAHPILAKSEDILEYITPDSTVILDPPRAGCGLKLIEKLLDATPESIIYLSCNPATQIRDIKYLSDKYQIATIQPYNFFPRTPHLENLIILEKLCH